MYRNDYLSGGQEMNKQQNNNDNNNKNKQNKEVSDFFQVLQSNGMFVDYVSPVKEAFAEIEKKLK